MIQEVNFLDVSNEILRGTMGGSFLTVKNGDEVNTMAIGWGAVGYMWNKPIYTALVRDTRYTYEFLEKNDEFTVSIPLDGQLKEAIKITGTKSGRDMDKIKECGLNLIESEKVNVPVIDGCNLYLECRTILKQRMDKELLSKEVDEKVYPNKDYHTMYQGEILRVYIKK